jgi:hypothetical protein
MRTVAAYDAVVCTCDKYVVLGLDASNGVDHTYVLILGSISAKSDPGGEFRICPVCCQRDDTNGDWPGPPARVPHGLAGLARE